MKMTGAGRRISSRAARFAGIERAGLPRGNTTRLQRRREMRALQAHVRAYLKIARRRGGLLPRAVRI